MKILVQFSGGKDSLASLIWAVKEFGNKKVVAVYCDTDWEHGYTYEHIQEVVKILDIEFVSLKSDTYNGLLGLSLTKKRFPSTKARFCTTELKVIPFIDYVLDVVKDDILVIQGIRKDESESRSKMESQCAFFKYYFEPYGFDKKGKPKKHTYRKKDIKVFVSQFCDDVIRPIFDWNVKQVFDYIKSNGIDSNKLYKRGATRVGCYPCIMSSHNEIRNMLDLEPEYFERIKNAETLVGRSFFPPDYIPKHACTNKKYPSANDVERYIKGKNETLEIFEVNKSCSSYYNLC